MGSGQKRRLNAASGAARFFARGLVALRTGTQLAGADPQQGQRHALPLLLGQAGNGWKNRSGCCLSAFGRAMGFKRKWDAANPGCIAGFASKGLVALQKGSFVAGKRPAPRWGDGLPGLLRQKRGAGL